MVDYDTDRVRRINYRALPGDANGDGSVDISDFGLWNANKFTVGTDGTTGDFNGVTDGSDFGILNSHKLTAVSNFHALIVAEPQCVSWWVLLFTLLRKRSDRR